ncbi:MAG: hypothetical protein IK045_01130 [Bacteroidales bacterium]|nr:hypothetical protein [Bacteroidales bacterium]
MEDLNHFYALFEKMIDEDSVYIDPSVDFHSICLVLGAPEKKLGDLIFEELGMDADSLLARLRELREQSLVEKYGNSFQKNYYLCPIRPSAGRKSTETKQ